MTDKKNLFELSEEVGRAERDSFVQALGFFVNAKNVQVHGEHTSILTSTNEYNFAKRGLEKYQ